MKIPEFPSAKRLTVAFAVIGALLLVGEHSLLQGQRQAGFPSGFDAAEAAPASHKVVFENAFVRVLQVTLPPAGSSEPMHYHRWPSLFLGYDAGGKSAHIRYHTPDGKVRDQPATEEPVHTGVWTADWMAPEPMHSIEVVEAPAPNPAAPRRGGSGLRSSARLSSGDPARQSMPPRPVLRVV